MKVVVINYGMGNLGSVRRALEECGAEALVTENPADLAVADRVVLPGVGAFAQGMANLHAANWVLPLRAALQNRRLVLLGICLGMQLLADEGEEGGQRPGLGLIPGKVVRLQPTAAEPRLPHVGWNEVHHTGQGWLLEGIPDRTDFYFVHSYQLAPADSAHALATTPYCGGFVSVAGRDNVFGVQFHPEKSGRPGFRLLQNFLSHRPEDA